MQNLSPKYKEIKQLRSTGDLAGAVTTLRGHPPSSDADAFEAVVCLFVCGDLQSALNVCRTREWKEDWAAAISQALQERFVSGNAERAIALAGKAIRNRGAPHDAAALYLLLLQDGGFIEEAHAYIRERLQKPPFSETFLLTVIAETALAAGDWRDAYRASSAVLANDPDDYRALIALSNANFEIGNLHEALGNAIRASFVRKGGLPAILQIMRCQNKLGDYYAALAALEKFDEQGVITPEVHIELGTAYLGVEDRSRAILHYRAALTAPSTRIEALRALIAIYGGGDDRSELDRLVLEYAGDLRSDVECVYSVARAALNRGDIEEGSKWFRQSRELAEANGYALADLPWPVPDARIRHDYEQLELLQRRGRLNDAGERALGVLKRYFRSDASVDATYAPDGVEAETLRQALCGSYYLPELSFVGGTLGGNDYSAIEDKYLSDGLVVIDDFLSPEALAALRCFCEEATVWKVNNARGYVGAVLAQGFSPDVLLKTVHDLRRAMPRILGDEPLLQAWGFKYDQRMQGINMHADFAKVNVNFWVTPDDACTDPTTGGMVVYDMPVPRSWTFYQYNNESERLAAYVKVHEAKAVRVPYRANRCVLFDSSLIHITDEMHFKPGYENRRVNVTLLFGRARAIE
jgi:tetratricopeptide (TPR) repeat protein